MRKTEQQATDMFSRDLQMAITRFRDALANSTLVLLLRQENARRFPGPDAPSVEELARDVFGRVWNDSAFKVEFRNVLETVPSLLALNNLMMKVFSDSQPELEPLFHGLPLDSQPDLGELELIVQRALLRPYNGRGPVIDSNHCHELIKLFQETRSEK